MRGIQMYINQSDKLSVLKLIDIERYHWHIPEEIVFEAKNRQYYYCDDPIIYNNITSDIMSGLELKKIIEEKSDAIEQINLRAFPIGVDITEPKDYLEYMKSDCFLVFLSHDFGIVEIYCKDDSIISRIFEKYKSSPLVERIELITDENDGRTRFYVGPH